VIGLTDKELTQIVNDIQAGDINKAESIVSSFTGLIHRNSYIDGILDEDCVQELNTKLISCLLSFKYEIESDIQEFLYLE
jgi:hypothetical protein